MFLFTLLGMIIGALTVVFALENTTVVTVNFMEWHLTTSVGFIVLGAFLTGIATTIASMLPRLISNELHEYAIRREQQRAASGTEYATTVTEQKVTS